MREVQPHVATVTANGVDFQCLELGSGPLALCLHGFPDTHRLRSPAMGATKPPLSPTMQWLSTKYLREMAMRSSLATTGAHLPLMVQHFLGLLKTWRRLLGITAQPLLYLHGENDGCIGKEVAELARTMVGNNVTVEFVKDAGHFLQLEQPDAVGKRTAEWITQ